MDLHVVKLNYLHVTLTHAQYSSSFGNMFDHFLLAKWIQKYLGKWKLFIYFFLKRYGVNVLMGNLNERDAASLEIEGRPLCQRTV